MINDLLLGFEVSNYRSIRSTQRLLLTRPTRSRDERWGDPDVVAVAAVFGPNASGKSNLLSAMRRMHNLLRRSATSESTTLAFEPFLLSDEAEDATSFEIDARLGGVRYSYSFSYDASRVVSERLLSWPKGRQRVLFERDVRKEEEWYFGDSLTGANQAAARATRSNALLLSTAQLVQHETLGPLQQSLVDLLSFVLPERSAQLLGATLGALQKDPELMDQLSALLSRADLGIVSLEIEEDEQVRAVHESAKQLFSLIQEQANPEVRFVLDETDSSLVPRLRHSGPKGAVPLPFDAESLGTRNFIALLGPVLSRLRTGGVLVIDEVDTSLHPRLVNELVRLFQSPVTNPRQAQLVLSTHDVTVMMNTGDYDVLGREEIWFVEKSSDGSTHLYPLTDFKVRVGEVFSRGYLMDRYGAIPHIDRGLFGEAVSEIREPRS